MGEGLDPDATSIIASFKALKGKEARRAAYHGILDQLLPDEWREVRERVDVRSFKYDILGSLPLELIARICEFLDLREIISLQRVSRCWNRLLSSPLIYRTAFRVDCINEPLPDVSDAEWQSLFIKYAKRRLLLELGRPYTKAVYPYRFKCWDFYPPQDVMAYCGGRFAWAETDRDGRSLGVAVHCLRSGTISRFTTENRELILCVRLSETAVSVVTGRGYCHLWNYTTGENGSFRLPSASIRDFVVNGGKVVISSATALSLIIYDLQTRTTRTIDLKSPPLRIIPHPSEDTLAVVQLDHICGNDSCKDHACPVTGIIVTRYSFDGPSVTRQQSPISLSLPRDRTWTLNRTVFPVRSSVHGAIQIPLRSSSVSSNSSSSSSSISSNNTHYAFVYYNLKTDKASLRIYGYEIDPPPLQPVLVSHNLMYYITDGTERPEIWIFNPDGPLKHRRSEITEIEGSLASGGTGDAAAPAAGGGHARRPHRRGFPFGDSEFFGLATPSGLEVWCFDEGDHMAADVPSYRQAREERARFRAQAGSVTPPTE
ncbi:hypothetical protein VTN02DRAFT_2576 [Thermoascus thermophilus]